MTDHLSTQVTSARLRYRRLSPRDLDAFHRLCLDEHVKRYLLDGLDMPRSWAMEAIHLSDRLFDTDDVGLWLVEREGAPIGFTGFRVFEELGPEPQLLYAFGGDHVGAGHATEAVGAMLARARRLGWSRVVAAVDAPNTASVRVLGKAGFVGCGWVPGQCGQTLLFERFEVTPPPRLEAPTGSRWVVQIRQTWDGEAVGSEEAVTITMERGDVGLRVQVDAPFHGDPPPDTDELWRHEVVEVMLLGAHDRYLEVELSPFGRHLVLFLHGERHVVHRGVTLDCQADIDGDRWRGVAHLPIGWLPVQTDRLNAFAIHGSSRQRRHLAWRPTGGQHPDFHQLARFGSFDDCEAPS